MGFPQTALQDTLLLRNPEPSVKTLRVRASSGPEKRSVLVADSVTNSPAKARRIPGVGWLAV
jgi:hypothetical protein